MLDRALWQMNKERHNHLLQIAENHRLAKLASSQSSHRERIFITLGDFLIALGAKLKARYEPVVQLKAFDPCEGFQNGASNHPCWRGESPYVRG